LDYLSVASLPPVPPSVNDQNSKATNIDKKFNGKVIRLITSVMTPGVHRNTTARRQSIEQQRGALEGAEANRAIPAQARRTFLISSYSFAAALRMSEITRQRAMQRIQQKCSERPVADIR
jgi:hypothetical protein